MHLQKPNTSPPISNIRNLRNILNKEKAPLSNYINKKHKNLTQKNLSYFDKLKCMIGSNDINFKSQNLTQNQRTIEKTKRSQMEDQAQNFRSKSFRKKKNFEDGQQLLASRRKAEKNMIQSIKADLMQRSRAISTLGAINEKPVKKQTVNYNNFQILYEEGQKFSKVELGKVLGSGANASVRLASQKNIAYAIKVYEKYKLLEPRKKKRVYTQIQLLSSLSPHHNIISLHQAYEDKRQIHMIFQHIEGAITLHQYFRDNYLYLEQKIIKQIFRKVAKGVAHLHSEGIAHRDIKPDNILLGFDEEPSINVKIIDFGFSTAVSRADLQCGTPNFMAPQLSDKTKKYCPLKVDSWALGILLFYLCEGRYPFKGFDEKDLFRNIRLGTYTIKKTINEDIISIIQMCLKTKAEERASLEEVLACNWVRN